MARPVTTPRAADSQPRQRRRRQVGLEAGHAVPADDGVVRRAGGQLQPIAGHEVDGLVAIGQAEADRARRAHQHLVVAVGMGGVAVARAVRPGSGVETLGPQARGGIGGRHG